jgi:hypothetical protein
LRKSFLTILFGAFLLIAVFLNTSIPSATAAGPIPITVIGSDGVSHGISDIAALSTTTGSGGYKSNSQLNWGVFQGISVLTLCNSIGTNLQSYQNVTVSTSGGSGTNISFNYDQVNNGINIAPQYSTYSNTTGSLVTTQPNPLTLIVAYQFANGTALPGTGSTRLLIVGPDGLLFQGPGMASVENITIYNASPPPTSTPSPSPTPSPTPTLTPTSSPTPTSTNTSTATPSPSPSPSPTPTQSPLPTPTISPSPTPSTNSGVWSTTNTIIIVAIIAVVALVVLLLIKRK